MQLVLSDGTSVDIPDGTSEKDVEFLRAHEELHRAHAKAPRPTELFITDPYTFAVCRMLGLV